MLEMSQVVIYIIIINNKEVLQARVTHPGHTLSCRNHL